MALSRFLLTEWEERERESTRSYGKNVSFVFQTYTRSDAHHMYTITSPSLNLSTLFALRPQSNPNILGADGRGVDRAPDLAPLQSPSAC